jgi:glutathione synthase/RimK-type ligase-like ATP-grasp enzyme
VKLLGLYREVEYSPGRHRSNDALLLEQVAESLRRRGLAVTLATLPTARGAARSAALVFSMCQGRAALEQLQRWEADGVAIVNRPTASLNTYRERLPSLMRNAGIRFPPTEFVATRAATDAGLDVNGGVWLKRGDVHAAVSADVQWIDSADRLRDALDEFRSRGIARAAVQCHQPGDEIKFYGVSGGAFFHWFYSSAGRRAPIDADALRQLAERAAAAAGLDVYGGDAIVTPERELVLIDLNDWPSFAPCRDRASEAIADYLMRRLHAAWGPGLVSSANKSAV